MNNLFLKKTITLISKKKREIQYSRRVKQMDINNIIEEQIQIMLNRISNDELDNCFKRPNRYPYTKEQWAPKVIHYHCYNNVEYIDTVYVNIHTGYVINSGVIYGK